MLEEQAGFQQINLFVCTKNKAGSGCHMMVSGANLGRVVREDIPEEVTFEQTLKGCGFMEK